VIEYNSLFKIFLELIRQLEVLEQLLAY